MDRFTTEFTRMTQNGIQKTVTAIPLDTNKTRFFPSSSTINSVLPYVEKRYYELLDCLKKTLSTQCIDKFFDEVQDKTIVGIGFLECLKKDLNTSFEELYNIISNTKYVITMVDKINVEYPKRAKDDPIGYAEACQQLIDLFGFANAFIFINNKGIPMKRRVFSYLYNISIMHPKVKAMIQNKEIDLTAAYDISPQLSEEKQLELAETIKNKTRSDARKILRRTRDF